MNFLQKIFGYFSRPFSITSAAIFMFFGCTANTHGAYWQAGMPPVGSGNTITCADGFTCARANQEGFFGSGIVKLGCYYTYNWAGAMTGASCDGWNNLTAKFSRSGYASLYCEAGEYRTASGCATKPAADKDQPRHQPKSCPGPGAPSGVMAGNPVDTRSGSKVEKVLDFSTGDDTPLKFERYYSSNTDYLFGNFIGTRLGRGWRSNFDSFAFYADGSSSPLYVHVVMPDGRTISFQPVSGVFQQRYLNWSTKLFVAGTQNEVATLVKNTTTSRYILTTSDDTVWSYDYSGRLRTITYRGGYSQELTYDGSGNNTLVQDSFGRQLTFTYSAHGLVSTVTVPGGQTYQYEYLGRYDSVTFSGVDPIYIAKQFWALEYVTIPDNTPSTTDNPKIQYHYENSSYPFALTGITDPRGVRFATWVYGTDGRVASSSHAGGIDDYQFSYDDVARTTTVTNPLGKQAVYRFSADARALNRLTQIEGLVSTNCAAANTSYTYDSTNFLNQITDGEGRITRYVNNTRGLPTSITRGYGTASAATTAITWHSTLYVPTQIVEPGLTTDLTWNTSGQLTGVTQTDTTSHTIPYSTNGQTRTWIYTYNTYGRLLTVDGPLAGTGDTVTYTYDTSGYLASVTNEVGHVLTVSAVNGRGQPTTVLDENGVTTNLTYDSEGRLKTVTVDPSGSAALTSIDYDAVGQITKITRPNGAYLQYTWNNAKRLTKIEDNTGAYVEYDHNDFGNVTARRIKTSGGSTVLSQTATFDELGRLLTFVGAASQTWTSAYDKTDNQVSVTDPRSNVYQWAFDSLSRLIRETNEESAQVNLTLNGNDEVTNYSDPRSLSTAYVRNGFGDIIQRTSPDSGTTVYEYNALSKVTKVTDGRSIVTNLTYDNAGRLLTRQYPAATAENVTQTWDSTASGNKGVGRLTKIDDASGSVEWVYNVLGQVTQEKKTTASQVYAVDYTYDVDGNVTEMTYPSGRIVTLARDALGRISGVSTRKDALSSTVTLASSVDYKPFGPLSSFTYGNGLVFTKTFTQDYLLATLKVEDTSTPTTILDRSYAFGDGINLTGITDNLISGRSESYTYTAANRLGQSNGIWGQLTWGYDGVGNRTSEVLTTGSVATRTYSYPGTSNKLASITEGVNVRSFTHDGAGNITADDRAGTVYNYRTNNRGRLDRLTIGATVTADYVYDGLERLAIRATQNMTPAGTTHYVYDRKGRLIAEAHDIGQTAREYVWLDDMPLAVIADVDTASPQLLFVHADHLDRPLKMTDASQALLWDAVFLPFGEATSVTTALNLRFPGQYFLIESGLHYNWHRHYDPTTGRYLQPDPLGFVDGPSVYAYAKSAPTIEVDNEGLAGWSVLRWFRHYKALRDGAKSGEQFLKHLKAQRDGQQRMRDLEELCKGAKGKEAKEYRELLRQEREKMEGHWKEMRQKWPEFMKDYEL